MAFKAASVVEPLEWDFHPYVQARGTVPEPTDVQIATFLDDLKKATEKVKDRLPNGTDRNDPAEVLEAINDLDATAITDIHQEMAGVFAALCSGEPSRDILLSLPMRVRTVFYGWLQQEVMSPEAAPGAGSAQVTTLRPAAAG